MKTPNTLITISFSHSNIKKIAKRKKRFQKEVETYWNKFFKTAFTAMGNFTAMLLTGTIFLGGSYLFFIQLAEYGW